MLLAGAWTHDAFKLARYILFDLTSVFGTMLFVSRRDFGQSATPKDNKLLLLSMLSPFETGHRSGLILCFKPCAYIAVDLVTYSHVLIGRASPVCTVLADKAFL